MSFSTHDRPEKEGDMFERSTLSGEETLGAEDELCSSVQEGRDLDRILGRKTAPVRQEGSDAGGSITELVLGFTNELRSSKLVLVPAQTQAHLSTDCSSAPKPEAASETIDIMCAQNVNNAKAHRKVYKKVHSMRESLLEEAWQRKKDHILHHQLNNTGKPKLEKAGRSVSFCGTTGRLQGEVTDRLSRMRSLTDDDFDELRGCIDLGFRFTQNCIPDLCETLPALEVCYAITQKLHDSQPCSSPVSSLHGVPSETPGSSSKESPISSWQICSPGENPQMVKARLRHWAQAVACTVRQSP